jgi:hypothetical protein
MSRAQEPALIDESTQSGRRMIVQSDKILSLRVSDGRTANAPAQLLPSGNCPHEAFPFVEAAAKAKLAGSIETQPGCRLATLAAFCIVDVPIRSARNKDVRCEWVVFAFHCRKLGLDITYRRSESFQCLLKARRPHDCSTEHLGCLASSGRFNDHMQRHNRCRH